MDFSNSQDSVPDSAYSPQILNDVDTNMGGAEEPTGKIFMKPELGKLSLPVYRLLSIQSCFITTS
jgi:hypothetical protein